MKYIQIKCTKRLAAEINKKCPYTVECIQLSEPYYIYNVGRFNACDTDYNWKTDKYNVLVVWYPDNFYACERYITTDMLNKIFARCDSSLDGFINEFNSEVEI